MFGISRQAIYQQGQRICVREKELQKVKQLIEDIRMEQPRIGTRKLYYLLKNKFRLEKIKIGRDALFDYLRRENLLIYPKKRYTKTTFSKHWLRKYPNLLKTTHLKRKEQVFVSDITYVKTKTNVCYLSLITDAYSRKIMGYELSENMNAENVVKALKMAVRNRTTGLSLIHHSDRGLQYCSEIYQKVLRENKIMPSMTDGYDCYQNALAERINGILKQEFLIYKCKNIHDLKQMVKESIYIYNNKRPHLSLKMK
ncbi:transposase InsO family protein, partial [Chryseobacterium sp. JUb7]|nr:transposase InsO family protein [Chryseobacterium sp. JUb7]